MTFIVQQAVSRANNVQIMTKVSRWKGRNIVYVFSACVRSCAFEATVECSHLIHSNSVEKTRLSHGAKECYSLNHVQTRKFYNLSNN